jgi:antibiotic biosynthesis monooxygenase (ABM) superfamily enzyme
MKKKKFETPQPYAAETRDQRFAGTFEVLIPVDGRNKPLRVPRQFESMQQAEAWLHSPDGKDSIAELIEDDVKTRDK